MRVGVSSRSFGLSSKASGRMQEESKEHKANVIRDGPAPAKEAHKEEMTIRHAAALALVGWYLMIPPLDSTGTHRTPPISLWATLKVFDTAVECSAAMKDVQDK